jgi:hypothetical protein
MTIMKKLMWAALLALPLFAAGPNRATAGACYDLQGCWRIKICAAGSMKCCREAFCCNQCCPGPGGGGGYGGGYGGCCGGGQDCSGNVPGPWYTFWPYNGQPYMTSAYATQGWVYDNNFQLPAPVYPYWPTNVTAAPAAPFSAPGFQPAGYYPSYWYGR